MSSYNGLIFFLVLRYNMNDAFKDHCAKVIQDIIIDYKDQLELTDQLEKKENEYRMCQLVLNGEYSSYNDGNIITSSFRIFSLIWDSEKSVDSVIDDRGLKQITDSGEIESIVDQVLRDNADQVKQYKD